MMDLRNKRALVVGLARTGRAAAQRLAREGATVTVTDSRPPASFGASLTELMERKVGLELGIHREETFVSQDLIVVSPGVPRDLPELEAARRRRIPILPEVEAASWFLRGTLVGVTGTNGKTTTVTLLGRMLEASDYPVLVAGNIGIPLIAAAEQVSPESIVVTELSSFQLEAIQSFRPHIAVLLNITENHLDRHHTFGAYVSAKAQLFRNQRAEDYAVLNADDPTVMSLAPAIASRKVFFSMEQDLPEGVLLSRGRILYRVGALERMLVEAREIKLRGAFNMQNVMAASAVACLLGADFKALRNAVREFTGVEHRLEFVRTVRGVDFYNDSKATSVDAAAKALSTFDRGVHLILGGKDKGAPYTPLKPLLEGRVKSVYLIGAAAGRIAADLEGADLYQAEDLATAVEMAAARAISGDVVLLAPACASYDQFQDFEERGRVFKELVSQLGEVPAMKSAAMPETGSGNSAIAEDESAVLGAEPRAGENAVENVPAFQRDSLKLELTGQEEEMPGGEQGIAKGSPAAQDVSPDVEAEPLISTSEARIARPGLPASSSGIEPPAYIYEVESEETVGSEADAAEFDASLEPDEAVPLRPLEVNLEPVSPYEVTDAPGGQEKDKKAEGR